MLSAGVLLAPAKRPRASEERVAPILEAQVERRESQRVFRGVQEVGERVLRHVVAFPAEGAGDVAAVHADFAVSATPGRTLTGYGLRVGPREVVTHVAALGGRPRLSAEGRGERYDLQVVAYEPESGLTLLEREGATPSDDDDRGPAMAAAIPEPGTLVVAAARAGEQALVAPVFVASQTGERLTLSAASGLTRPGTPIFTVDGEALGIATDPARGTAAQFVGGVLERLRVLAASGRGLPSSLGLYFQPLRGALAEHYGTPGALVADADESGPAALAGIQPGDLVVEIGPMPVPGAAAAVEAIRSLPPGAEVRVAVRRAGRPQAFTLRTIPALGVPGPRLLGPAEGPAAGAVFPPHWVRHGVPDTAIVLALSGQPVGSISAARAALAGARAPVVVHLHHEGRRFVGLAEPGA